MTEPKMNVFKIRRIDILPFAQMLALLHGSLGFLIGSLASIGSLFRAEGDSVILFGPLSFVILPVLNLILGFIGGALIALAYNASASLFGGVKIQLEE